MDLSIVIVNFNNRGVLEGCLHALMPTLEGLEAEVILSDNGSTDDSLAWVRQHYPQVRILENKANLGFAEGNNRAFPQTSGRHILLLNPDTVVSSGAVRALTELLDKEPNAGAVGCKLLNGDGSRQISARSFPTISTYLWHFLGLAYRKPKSKVFGAFGMTYWEGDDERQVDWVCGAVLMIRREVLETVGPLDAYFFLTYDEVDWCHRIKDAGYQVWYTNATTITHLDRQSEPQSNPKPEARIKYMTVERNSRVRFFVKHHGRLYATLVELLHLLMCALLWLKATVMGTGQSPVATMEKKLMLQLYWRTACRAPKVLWNRTICLVSRAGERARLEWFVNPYLADDH